MRFSSKLTYALRALFDITFHNLGRPTKVDEIAAREDIPARFLEQIFQDLKDAQIVGSKRGPNGGYFLVRSPDAVTIGDVLRAVEGPIEAASALEEEPRRGATGPLSSKEVTEVVWRDLVVRIGSVLDAVTLADLSLRGDAMGLKRDPGAAFSYVI